MTPSGGTVSLLFTDLVGSTALMNQIGDEPAEELRRAHYRLLRQAVTANQGHEAKNLGDGLMVVFDSATSAVACAVAIQRAVRRHNQDQPHPMEVRVGINVGEPIRSQEDYFGWSVVTARRLCDQAEGGQILASDVVTHLAQPDTTISFRAVGDLPVGSRGKAVAAFEVVWEAATEEKLALPPQVRDHPLEHFVGRDADLGRLRLSWSRAAQGSRQLFFVGAEPGMGKTSLVMRAAREFQEQGAAVLYGGCDEETLVPYQPFVEAARGYLQVCPRAELGEQLRSTASDLSRIVSEIADVLPGTEKPLELTPEEARYRVFDAFRRLLAAATSAWPVLLVLEDLHWVDRGSLLLLQFLVRELPTANLMILGTYRDNEVDKRHPLSLAMADMRRDANVQRIYLGGLSVDEVGDMLEAESGHEIDERALAVVHAVHQQTEGNPLFVSGIMEHLLYSGRVSYADGRWITDIRTAADISAPEGVTSAIGMRLSQLPTESTATLELASVIGTEFSLPLLRAVADTTEDRLIDVLDAAVGVHLLTEAADRPGIFRFSHALVRSVLYEGLSRTRRARMHQRIADAIESELEAAESRHSRALPAGTPLRVAAAQLAAHLIEAAVPGNEAKMARYLRVAGDDALAATAYEDALGYYRQARDLLPPDSDERVSLAFNLGLAQRDVGHWEDALDTWREALEAAIALGDKDAVGHLAWDICYQLVWAGRHVECLEIAGRGLNALGDAETPSRGHLLAVTGSTFGFAGNYEIGDEMTASALELAQRLGDEELMGDALTMRTGFYFAFNQLTQASETGLTATAISRKLGNLWNVGTDLALAYFAEVALGRTGETNGIAIELKEIIGRLGHHGADLLYTRAEMLRAAADGDHAAYRGWAERDLAICAKAGLAWTDTSHAYLGAAAFWSGDWVEAEAHYRRALETETPSFTAGVAGGALFRLLAYQGEAEAAMALYTQVRHDIADAGRPNAIGRWIALVHSVIGLSLLDHDEEAAALAPLVDEFLGMGAVVNTHDAGLVETVAGVAWAAAKQWDVAQRHFDAAMAQAEVMPHRVEQADIRRFRARMLRARNQPGDAAAADALLEEAAAIYRELDMPRHLRLLEAAAAERL
ncbi:MAG: AAA family ATPase [Candidatus Dormiibacterota bacterium]